MVGSTPLRSITPLLQNVRSGENPESINYAGIYNYLIKVYDAL